MPAARTNIDLQAEWEKAWMDARKSFAKATGKELAQQPMSPAQVLEQIHLKDERDEEKAAKYKTARNVLDKTLTLVTTLGGIAAQGASMVFGPSQMCFNAVTFLIDAGKNYKKIFAGITDLFGRISDALERFQVYLRMGEMVDIALKGIIHQVLLCFVSICELSATVLHKKAFAFGKILAFNDDGGVQAKVDELARIVEREDQMRSTLTFESGKVTEKKLDATNEGIRNVQDDVAILSLDKQRENIRIKLGSPPAESYKKPLEERSQCLVEGSGSWIFEEASFKSWADLQQSVANSVLYISGKKGFGKSHLSSAIVNELRRKHLHTRAGDCSRVSVAYFFFDRDAKASNAEHTQPRDSLEVALKAVAWQIVQEDTVYQKELSSVVESRLELNTVKQLWEKLLVEVKADSTFYIICDGIDQMDEKHRKLLPSLIKENRTGGKSSPRIRLLLSGTPAAFDTLQNGVDFAIPCIDLALDNSSDIAKFIENKVAEMPIFKTASPQVQTLKTEVLETLTENAHGDFANVDMLLSEIGSKQWPRDIRAVLDDSKSESGRKNTIARKIQDANDTLPAQEIKDLNILLLWVLKGSQWMTVKELKAVLFVANQQESLRPLSVQIETQYSLFLSIERDAATAEGEDGNDYVYPQSDLIQKYFEDLTEQKLSEDHQQDASLTKSEVQLVKRFLRTICDQELFDKFGFEDFFDSKLEGSDAVVRVDLQTADLQIASTCLQVLCTEDEGETQAFHVSAAIMFLDHLDNLELPFVEPRKKTEIGTLLIRLFTDEEVIKRWWTETQAASYLISDWLQKDVNVELILTWFKDPAVKRGLSESDNQWIESLTQDHKADENDESPAHVDEVSGDLMFHVVKYVAGQWLLDNIWDVSSAFKTISSYIQVIGHREDPSWQSQQRSLSRSQSTVLIDTVFKGMPNKRELSKVLSWAAQALEGPQHQDWLSNQAAAYAYFEHFDEAEALYREAIKKAKAEDKDPYQASVGLAEALAGKHEFRAAIDVLHSVLQRVKTESTEQEERLAHCFGLFGKYFEGDGQVELAIEYYRQQVTAQTSEASLQGVAGIVKLLKGQQRWQDIVKLLRDLESEEKEGRDRLTTLYIYYAHDQDFHQWIQFAGKRANSIEIIRSWYLKALETVGVSSRNEAIGTKQLLQYHYAFVLFNHPLSELEQTKAIETWNLVAGRGLSLSSNDTLQYAQTTARKKLASVHYDAFLATRDREQVEKLDNVCARFNVGKKLLGRCYLELKEEEKARQELRGDVKDGIEILSDDDPSNDWIGWTNLGTTLMLAGDEKNALAAWSRLGIEWQESPAPDAGETTRDDVMYDAISPGTKPAEVSVNGLSNLHADAPSAAPSNGFVNGSADTILSATTDPGSTADPAASLAQKPAPGSWVLNGVVTVYCDGCSETWRRREDIDMCVDCLDSAFCRTCAAAKARGELEHQFCSAAHRSLRVPGFRAEQMAGVGPDELVVGGTPVPVTQWLADLRREWEIPEWDADEDSTSEDGDGEDKKDEDEKDKTEGNEHEGKGNAEKEST